MIAVLSAPFNLSGLLSANAENTDEGDEENGLGDFISIGSDDDDEEVGDIKNTEYKDSISTTTSTKTPRAPRPPRPEREFKNLGEIISVLNHDDLASSSEEIKKVILEHKESLTQSEQRIKKIEKGSSFGEFFFGVNREALDGLKKDSMQAEARAAMLAALASTTISNSTDISDAEIDKLQDEIQAIKSSRQKISQFVDENKDKRGALGWFVDLFR